MQICNCCGIEKSITEFEWQKNRPSPRKTCKQCRYNKRDKKKENAVAKERKALWREANKDKLRQRWEKSVYGKCKEELGEQSCRICGTKETLCIDHCHTTGEVRGLLCRKCNFGIGSFDDNIELLLNAVKYLAKD